MSAINSLPQSPEANAPVHPWAALGRELQQTFEAARPAPPTDQVDTLVVGDSRPALAVGTGNSQVDRRLEALNQHGVIGIDGPERVNLNGVLLREGRMHHSAMVTNPDGTYDYDGQSALEGFEPQWRTVQSTVRNPDGSVAGVQQLNPDHYATLETARDVARRMGGTRIVEVNSAFTTGPQYEVEFPGGARLNAGLVAFRLARDGEAAMPGLQAEIRQNAGSQGLYDSDRYLSVGAPQEPGTLASVWSSITSWFRRMFS